MRILVCGGRDFNNTQLMWDVLDELPEIKNGPHPTIIIHGCAKGADTLAGTYADCCDYEKEEYPADWEKYGKAAGPIRNKQMLEESKPDLVIAFPGGKGTANMVKLAREAGVEVHEIN